MESIRITGGRPLEGRIPISGAKNAALPLLAAGLLTERPLRLANLPRLADIETMLRLLAGHGVDITLDNGGADSAGQRVTLATRDLADATAPYDIVRKMRASVLVLAGLGAEGETMVNRVYHLDRGYERIEAKLAACGASIERVAG